MDAEDFRVWRSALGLTQAQAADRLGLKREAYASYEAGRRKAPDEVTQKLATDTGLADTNATDTSQGDTKERIEPEFVSPAVPAVSPDWRADLETRLGRKLTPWEIPPGLIRRDFTALPLRPGWQVCGHRVVHGSIPDPVPFDAKPSWAKAYAGADYWPTLTKSGRVYRSDNGAQLKPLSHGPRVIELAGSRLIEKKRRGT